jgi:transcriptional regulator with AAA-type ATPase domain
VVNCGIVPAGLLETELFGFQGGAFTGSDTEQASKLEQAKDGILFIDEIYRQPFIRENIMGLFQNHIWNIQLLLCEFQSLKLLPLDFSNRSRDLTA